MQIRNKTKSQVTIKALGLKPITLGPNGNYEFFNLEELKVYKPLIAKIEGLELDLSPKVEVKPVIKEQVETPIVKEENIVRRGRRPNPIIEKEEPLKQE